MIRLAVAVFVLMTAAPAWASGRDGRAWEQPPVGKARVAIHPERDSGTGGVLVPVVVDLKDVYWNDQPAVLGAYVVRVVFDPAQVEFHGAAGGSDPYFAAPPIVTAPELANERGWAKVTYAQLQTLQPVGMVNVAKLRFTERVSGGAASIRVVLESASSALQRDGNGNLMRRLAIGVYREGEE